ncbi:MAG: MgtC/SapB family protein [Dehalococcoidia bacterium]
MDNAEQLDLLGRTLAAMLMGAIVGIEREFRGHEAGVRTSALVCAGAALFGVVDTMFQDSRVAAGVVGGVGFLGAGVIFQRGNAPRGVTTATTIWVLAGIGLATAAGLWIVAVVTTLVVVVLLEASAISDAIRHVGREMDAHQAAEARQRPDEP